MNQELGLAPCLSVLVPAYNEEKTIETVLRRVLALPIVKEVIVVDDCSTDATAAAVNRVEDPRLVLLRQPRNAGKTAAIQRAVEAVTGDVVIIQDADLEYDPSEIPAVVEPILRGNADVVYGSRFLVRKAARVLYYYHALANHSLTTFSNLLTNLNLTDVETGYKAFRTEVIRGMPLVSRGFGMEIEVTATVAKLGVRIYEVPISYYGRTYEEGKKIGFRDGLSALWYILYFNALEPHVGRRKRFLKLAKERLERASARFPGMDTLYPSSASSVELNATGDTARSATPAAQ